MTHARFGMLRALLQETPSEEVWRALLEELALWEDAERDAVALPYALAHLDRWPAQQSRGSWQHRALPWAMWLSNQLCDDDPARVAAQAQEVSWAARCRHLVLEQSAGVEALLPHLDSFGQIVSLKVSTYKLDGELACALMRRAWPPSLRALSIHGLSHVHKDTRRQIIEAMTQNASLEGIESLGLWHGELGVARIKPLVSSPLARRLHTLDLTGNVIDAACARELLEVQALERLTTLNLSSCKIDEASARLLAQSPLLATVTHLDLSQNPLNAGLAALLRSPHTRALTTLVTKSSHLDPAGARALRDVAWPAGLEALDLSQIHLSGHTSEALADAPILQLVRGFLWHGRAADQPTRLMASPHLTGLRELTLHHSVAALEAAARNPALRELETLSIYVQRLDAAQAEALRQSVFSDTLRSLTLSVRRGGVSGLCAPGAWRGLRHLDLGGRAYDDRSPEDSVLCDDVEIERLAQSGALAGLASLRLHQNRLTDLAALALADSGQLGALRVLHLPKNRIGPRGVRALVERGGLDRLETWSLAYNPIGDEGAALLATDKVSAPLFCELAREGLIWCGIGLAGAQALLRSPHIGQVQQLDISATGFTAEDAIQLARDPALANLRGTLRLRIEGDDEAAWLPLLRSPYASQPTRDHAQQAINSLRYYAQARTRT